ncbi:MAG: hypothetical protein AAFU77_05215 [Myxococcota bacterium]
MEARTLPETCTAVGEDNKALPDDRAIQNGLAMQAAVNSALAWLGTTSEAQCDSAEVVIRIPDGTWFVAPVPGDKWPKATTIVDVSNSLESWQAITIEGGGRTKTTVRQHLWGELFVSKGGVQNLTIRQMTVEQDVPPRATQGELVAIDSTSGVLTLELENGFPPLPQIDPNCRSDTHKGKYLRRFLRQEDESSPRMAPTREGQESRMFAFRDVIELGKQRYAVQLDKPREAQHLEVGDLVALRGKYGAGTIMRFVSTEESGHGGDNVTISNVDFRIAARIKFEKVNSVTFESNRVLRPEPIDGVRFALSTAGGGPQIHEGTGHLVSDNRFLGMGDDNVAFFGLSLCETCKPTFVRRNEFARALSRGFLTNDSSSDTCYDLVANPAEFAERRDEILKKYPLLNFEENNFFAHTGPVFKTDFGGGAKCASFE